ncbi:MAG: tetratricopeptide repeat protein [Bacteroidales bacterium]|nr:tetratricopeptide repeat protein [Bacteroidales bacterium]
MNKVIEQHREIVSLIARRRVKQSLDILREMMEKGSPGLFNDDYESLTMTYRNMLRYTIEGVKDPERDKIYRKMLQALLGLSDKVKQDILSRYSGWHTYWVKQQTETEQLRSGKSLVETVDDLMFKQDLDDWLNIAGEVSTDHGSEPARLHKLLIRNIFNHLWLADTYGEAEMSLTEIIEKSGKFRWYESSIFISAITLSALRVFQVDKIKVLLAFYNSGADQVKARALAGLIIILHYHNERISLYPEVGEWLARAVEGDRFREHCRIIVLQLLRSRETEKLGRKLTEEILPQVARLKPRIEEKLDLDNILPEGAGEDKNPDWSDMFGDSEEIFKSFEELTKLQMEGADVYMQAFSNLKHFDFFRDFENWFMPFHPDHEAVDDIFRDEILGPGTNDLAEALYKTPFICNSDKYSLLLNLKYLPSAQKTMMLKVFRMELEGLGQFEETESATDPFRTFRTAITQYLQDIYRFFKLSPYKKEFEDIFSDRLDVYNSEFYRDYCSTPESNLSMADYLFSKDFFSDAHDLYAERLKEDPANVQLYEKIGYCHQQEGDYDEALKYYQRAELIERRVWTVKKIGLCLRKLGRFEKALEYYLHAADSDRSDKHTTLMIAHCYLDLKDYESALQYYFKIEYDQPGNTRILRPIAWCYFALGKFEESHKYYRMLQTAQVTAHDYINMGHLSLCMGNKKEAASYYRQSLSTGGFSREDFLHTMKYDQQLLLDHGVDPSDLPIITDYVLFLAG